VINLNPLGHNLLRMHGIDPAGWTIVALPDDSVRVCSLTVSVVYPAPAWISKFTRDLHHGCFDGQEALALS
jgi:hypothetical protein